MPHSLQYEIQVNNLVLCSWHGKLPLCWCQAIQYMLKGAMSCLHAVLCFDVWKLSHSTLVQDQLVALLSCQVHVAGGKVQASHDFIGPQNNQML